MRISVEINFGFKPWHCNLFFRKCKFSIAFFFVCVSFSFCQIAQYIFNSFGYFIFRRQFYICSCFFSFFSHVFHFKMVLIFGSPPLYFSYMTRFKVTLNLIYINKLLFVFFSLMYSVHSVHITIGLQLKSVVVNRQKEKKRNQSELK